ncbi:MAG: TIR domain-containing protein [Bacteroidota bacterium]
MNLDQEIGNAIQRGDLQHAIELLLKYAQENGLDDLYNDIILLSGRYHRNETQLNRGIHDNRDYTLESNRINSALTHYIKQYIGEEPSGSGKHKRSINKQTIFISYSRKDILVADKLKKGLLNENVDVLIDEIGLMPGENIESWIRKSIKESDYVIAIISEDSLLSKWVIWEALYSLQAQDFSQTQLIAAYIDDIFLEEGGVDKLLDKNDEQIKSIRLRINQRNEKRRAIDDLENDLKRLTTINNRLPFIVQWLKEHLSVNITQEAFDSGMARIIAKINS